MAELKPPPAPWVAALGRIPSGLFIVTLARDGKETGMLASWVQQCSFDPPTVSVAIKKKRYVLDWLTTGTEFAVNVIGESQKDLIAHFGKGFDPEEPAFEGVEVDRTSGVPILTAAVAHLRMQAAGRLDAGDHKLVLGRVVAGAVHTDARPKVHLRKSGLHY